MNGERYTVICYSNCFNGLILCYLFSHKKCFGWIIVPLNQILLKELVELFNKRSVRLTNAEWLHYQKNGEISYVRLVHDEKLTPFHFVFLGIKKR